MNTGFFAKTMKGLLVWVCAGFLLLSACQPGAQPSMTPPFGAITEPFETKQPLEVVTPTRIPAFLLPDELEYMSPPNILDQAGVLLHHKDPEACPVYYGPLGTRELIPTYWIQQWSISDELPGPPDSVPVFEGCDQSMRPLWGTANSQARVCAYADTDPARPTGRIIELAQSGSVRNKEGQIACSQEYDLFISPVQANAADYLRKRFLIGIKRGFIGYDEPLNLPLSDLNKLVVRMQMQLAYHDNTQWGCGLKECGFDDGGHDYGYVVLGLWFSNRWDDKDPRVLTLNYQVILWDSHFDARPKEYQCANRNACEEGGDWYSLPNSWAYAAGLGNYVTPPYCITASDSSWKEYELDVLPKVTNLITTEPMTPTWPYAEIQQSDVPPSRLKDLSRWKLTGAYLGTGIQGRMVITTRYKLFRITGEPK